jgi:hypothetical protein
MYFKVSTKFGNCCFEYYNKEKKIMEECGRVTNIEIGRDQYICKDCLGDAMARYPKARLFVNDKDETFSRDLFLQKAGAGK